MKEESRGRRRVRAWATRGRRGRRRTSNGSRQRSRQVNRIEQNIIEYVYRICTSISLNLK
jgi:hypothetical protein